VRQAQGSEDGSPQLPKLVYTPSSAEGERDALQVRLCCCQTLLSTLAPDFNYYLVDFFPLLTQQYRPSFPGWGGRMRSFQTAWVQSIIRSPPHCLSCRSTFDDLVCGPLSPDRAESRRYLGWWRRKSLEGRKKPGEVTGASGRHDGFDGASTDRSLAPHQPPEYARGPKTVSSSRRIRHCSKAMMPGNEQMQPSDFSTCPKGRRCMPLTQSRRGRVSHPCSPIVRFLSRPVAMTYEQWLNRGESA
jgi:hypothetical protein